MILNSCVPFSIVSVKCIRKYVNEKVVDENYLEYRNCVRIFRFRENVYLTTKEVIFPIIVRVEDGDYIRRDVMANVVDMEEEWFFMWNENIDGNVYWRSYVNKIGEIRKIE